ncbi:MAG TPA: SDR family oxidoreductase [Acidimicrobiales bacterium]|nr:SDR family oxidoreductase [Acidimicrobiales bacterium]
MTGSGGGTLDGRVAIVTGSSSGIGAAIARSLTGLGTRVVINSSSSVEVGRALASELPGAVYIQADVSDERQADRLVAGALDQLGRLDILVNNAGTTRVIPHADIDAVTTEVWEQILGVNVIGTWNVTRAAVPHLKASGDGCIVNITSLAGVRPTGSSIPYAASKAALNHLTVLLANTLGPEIRVNAVAPGLVDTPWTESWDVVRDVVNATAPLQRSGQPDDVATATVGLILTRYATGQILVVDGGLGLR